jgi:rhomboid protease GluP
MAYYSGRRGNSYFAKAPVNSAIIAANIIVFILLSMGGDTTDAQYMYLHGADFWPDVFYNHEYWRLITCAFIHFGTSHIFNNMLVLAFIGDNLEHALGHIRYLIFYMACAVLSSLASDYWAMHTGSYAVSGGASGAIFGVVGGLLFIVIMNRGRLEDLSTEQLMLFAAFSIYHGVMSAGTDNAAHVGGLIAGAVLALILYRKKSSGRRNRSEWNGGYDNSSYYDI